MRDTWNTAIKISDIRTEDRERFASLGIDFSSFHKNYAGVYFVTKQSSYLKPIFDECEKYDWLYHKNYVSEELQELEHNDCYGTNSIMYFSKSHRIIL